MEISLTVSMPVGGDDGMGTIEDLDFRHALECRLDAMLRARALGWVDGGGAGFGWQDIFLVVHRKTWRSAWDAVRTTLEDQAVLDRPGLRVTLEDHPVAQVLCPLPLGVWRVERLTAGELAGLVEQLGPLLNRTLAHYVHMDPNGDQAVLDTARDAYDALQELFDAVLAAWRATIQVSVTP